MTEHTVDFTALRRKVANLIDESNNNIATMQAMCELLKENVPHYDWVGFYLVDSENERELVLGPFAGEPTDHVRIPFGKGICGQAADREKTFLIQDVSKETNYLSCSAVVNSEIVVPIFKNGVIAGELDIDSHQLEPFTPADEDFLNEVCRMIERII